MSRVRVYSAREQKAKSMEFQISHIQNSKDESDKKFRRLIMDKREEILERMVEICHRKGSNNVKWITESNIKQDPMITWADVVRTFGGVKALRRAVTRQLLDLEEDIQAKELKLKDGQPASEESKDEIFKDETSAEKPENLSQAKKQRPHRKGLSDEQLWAEMRERARELGRPMTEQELKDDPTTSAPQTYYRHLGGNWRKVIKKELAAEKSKKNPAIEELESDEIIEEIIEDPSDNFVKQLTSDDLARTLSEGIDSEAEEKRYLEPEELLEILDGPSEEELASQVIDISSLSELTSILEINGPLYTMVKISNHLDATIKYRYMMSGTPVFITIEAKK